MMLFGAFFGFTWRFGPFDRLTGHLAAFLYLGCGLAFLGFIFGVVGKGQARLGAMVPGLIMTIAWWALAAIGAIM